MASPTRITRRRRKMKKHTRGLDRKRRLKKQGSTQSKEALFAASQ